MAIIETTWEALRILVDDRLTTPLTRAALQGDFGLIETWCTYLAQLDRFRVET